MPNKTVFVLIIVTILVATVFFSPNISQVHAASPVTIKFATNGLNSYDGTVLTIDGVAYGYWDLPWTNFLWESGSTHTVVASTPLTGWDSNVYQFSSWTNGNGLTGASGTFTVPASSTTVTANYALSSVRVTFARNGLSNFNGVVLTIDGTAYDYWNMPSFLWAAGSTHTVTASTPLTGWDSNIYRFSSWTNGNGLTEASGTLIVPASDTTVTVNYAKTSVKVSFATSGLGSLNDVVLTIDGVGYDYWNVPWTSFIWESGSTHTVVASTPLTSLDSNVYQFSSWTNGNGLTGASGTFTVPTSNTTVTANYALSTTPATTSITVNCSPLTVDKIGTETTTISGYLTSGGVGIASKAVTVSYNDGTFHTIGTCVTGVNGFYQFQWDVPAFVANGYYVIKADFAGDSTYSSASAQTSGGGNLFVVPEFPFGALAALAACIGAFGLFKKRGRFSRLTKY